MSLLESIPGIGSNALSSLGTHIAVPFQVHPLSSARVVWLNHRWLTTHGVDSRDAEVRRKLEAELLAVFAVSAPRGNEPNSFFGEGTSTLMADRYGAPAGPDHGGSGRCGMRGSFNAKGIGPTPLAASTTDWHHRHGCMWLEEAIREAILGEIVAAEFPHGAIPAIAVISIDERVVDRLGGRLEDRRGILIRPNFIRPAHFERSVLFGFGGAESSPRHLDALRTKEAIEALESANGGGSFTLGTDVTDLRETFIRLGEQVGFGWAHRLFHGAYVSSNMTLDGELADFGSFRALPSWRAALTVEGAFPFGRDVHSLRPVIQSISFYLKKFAGPSVRLDARELSMATIGAAEKVFSRELLRMFDVVQAEDLASDELVLSEIKKYFASQQTEVVNYMAGDHKRTSTWIYKSLYDLECRSKQNAESDLINALDSIFADDSLVLQGTGRPMSRRLAVATRLLKPRRLIYRENLLRMCLWITQDRWADRPDYSQIIQSFVDSVIGKSLRSVRGLADDVIICGQSFQEGVTILYCRSSTPEQSLFLVFEAPSVGGFVWYLNKKFLVSSLVEDMCDLKAGGIVSYRVYVDSLPLKRGAEVMITQSDSVFVPRAQMRYTSSC